METFESEEIDATVSLELYTLPSDQACDEVRSVLYSLYIPFIERDCTELENMRALRERSGTEDVPYLYDTRAEKGIAGKDDIIEYLREHYEEDAISHLL